MSIKIIAIATLALGCATVAHAAPPLTGPVSGPNADRETVTLSVPMEGLDLSSPRGAKIALARIHQAAANVCGAIPNPASLAAGNAQRACLKTTVDTAVVAANNPMITSLHTPAKASRLASSRR
ncbi:UrcA family protein [Phenylobacterium sp. LH3H17]|uniref:UrcA family protein n=1 Tax=Phenylobacterium sp. LH3H17 TaxID=2903901 RepID=UPI0020C9C1E6|nr:UrcA family protein [Phenylobacterium sp. LH3H17]UTP38032.1 UrcA family protein [Phenylobacterium sp. LH3H17]